MSKNILSKVKSKLPNVKNSTSHFSETNANSADANQYVKSTNTTNSSNSQTRPFTPQPIKRQDQSISYPDLKLSPVGQAQESNTSESKKLMTPSSYKNILFPNSATPNLISGKNAFMKEMLDKFNDVYKNIPAFNIKAQKVTQNDLEQMDELFGYLNQNVEFLISNGSKDLILALFQISKSLLYKAQNAASDAPQFNDVLDKAKGISNKAVEIIERATNVGSMELKMPQGVITKFFDDNFYVVGDEFSNSPNKVKITDSQKEMLLSTSKEFYKDNGELKVRQYDIIDEAKGGSIDHFIDGLNTLPTDDSISFSSKKSVSPSSALNSTAQNKHFASQKSMGDTTDVMGKMLTNFFAVYSNIPQSLTKHTTPTNTLSTKIKTLQKYVTNLKESGSISAQNPELIIELLQLSKALLNKIQSLNAVSFANTLSNIRQICEDVVDIINDATVDYQGMSITIGDMDNFITSHFEDMHSRYIKDRSKHRITDEEKQMLKSATKLVLSRNADTLTVRDYNKNDINNDKDDLITALRKLNKHHASDQSLTNDMLSQEVLEETQGDIKSDENKFTIVFDDNASVSDLEETKDDVDEDKSVITENTFNDVSDDDAEEEENYQDVVIKLSMNSSYDDAAGDTNDNNHNNNNNNDNDNNQADDDQNQENEHEDTSKDSDINDDERSVSSDDDGSESSRSEGESDRDSDEEEDKVLPNKKEKNTNILPSFSHKGKVYSSVSGHKSKVKPWENMPDTRAILEASKKADVEKKQKFEALKQKEKKQAIEDAREWKKQQNIEKQVEKARIAEENKAINEINHMMEEDVRIEAQPVKKVLLPIVPQQNSLPARITTFKPVQGLLYTVENLPEIDKNEEASMMEKADAQQSALPAIVKKQNHSKKKNSTVLNKINGRIADAEIIDEEALMLRESEKGLIKKNNHVTDDEARMMEKADAQQSALPAIIKKQNHSKKKNSTVLNKINDRIADAEIIDEEALMLQESEKGLIKKNNHVTDEGNTDHIAKEESMMKDGADPKPKKPFRLTAAEDMPYSSPVKPPKFAQPEYQEITGSGDFEEEYGDSFVVENIYEDDEHKSVSSVSDDDTLPKKKEKNTNALPSFSHKGKVYSSVSGHKSKVKPWENMPDTRAVLEVTKKADSEKKQKFEAKKQKEQKQAIEDAREWKKQQNIEKQVEKARIAEENKAINEINHMMEEDVRIEAQPVKKVLLPIVPQQKSLPARITTFKPVQGMLYTIENLPDLSSVQNPKTDDELIIPTNGVGENQSAFSGNHNQIIELQDINEYGEFEDNRNKIIELQDTDEYGEFEEDSTDSDSEVEVDNDNTQLNNSIDMNNISTATTSGENASEQHTNTVIKKIEDISDDEWIKGAKKRKDVNPFIPPVPSIHTAFPVIPVPNTNKNVDKNTGGNVGELNPNKTVGSSDVPSGIVPDQPSFENNENDVTELKDFEDTIDFNNISNISLDPFDEPFVDTSIADISAIYDNSDDEEDDEELGTTPQTNDILNGGKDMLPSQNNKTGGVIPLPFTPQKQKNVQKVPKPLKKDNSFQSGSFGEETGEGGDLGIPGTNPLINHNREILSDMIEGFFETLEILVHERGLGEHSEEFDEMYRYYDDEPLLISSMPSFTYGKLKEMLNYANNLADNHTYATNEEFMRDLMHGMNEIIKQPTFGRYYEDVDGGLRKLMQDKFAEEFAKLQNNLINEYGDFEQPTHHVDPMLSNLPQVPHLNTALQPLDTNANYVPAPLPFILPIHNHEQKDDATNDLITILQNNQDNASQQFSQDIENEVNGLGQQLMTGYNDERVNNARVNNSNVAPIFLPHLPVPHIENEVNGLGHQLMTGYNDERLNNARVNNSNVTPIFLKDKAFEQKTVTGGEEIANLPPVPSNTNAGFRNDGSTISTIPGTDDDISLNTIDEFEDDDMSIYTDLPDDNFSEIEPGAVNETINRLKTIKQYNGKSFKVEDVNVKPGNTDALRDLLFGNKPVPTPPPPAPVVKTDDVPPPPPPVVNEEPAIKPVVIPLPVIPPVVIPPVINPFVVPASIKPNIIDNKGFIPGSPQDKSYVFVTNTGSETELEEEHNNVPILPELRVVAEETVAAKKAFDTLKVAMAKCSFDMAKSRQEFAKQLESFVSKYKGSHKVMHDMYDWLDGYIGNYIHCNNKSVTAQVVNDLKLQCFFNAVKQDVKACDSKDDGIQHYDPKWLDSHQEILGDYHNTHMKYIDHISH